MLLGCFTSCCLSTCVLSVHDRSMFILPFPSQATSLIRVIN